MIFRVTGHISTDLENRLAKLTSAQLIQLNPSLSNSSAEQGSIAIRSLISLLHGSIPIFSTQTHLNKRQLDINYEDTFSSRPWTDNHLTSHGLYYDEQKNRLRTYLVDTSHPDHHLMIQRTWHPRRLHARQIQAHVPVPTWYEQSIPSRLQSRNLNNLADHPKETLIAADEQNGWYVAIQHKTHEWVTTIKSKAGKFASFVFETALQVWDAIIEIFMNMAIHIIVIFILL